jgi:hypothetical protein
MSQFIPKPCTPVHSHPASLTHTRRRDFAGSK